MCTPGRCGTHAVRAARWRHATASMSAGVAAINKGILHVPISRSTLPATATSTAPAPLRVVAKRLGFKLKYRRCAVTFTSKPPNAEQGRDLDQNSKEFPNVEFQV